jgi:3-oxoadipate enol-lactonase
VTQFNSSPTQSIHFLDPNPGGSPGVLLLHGLGASGDSWILQFPVLMHAGMRPIAPDMRGFGQSSFDGSSSIELMAEDCCALIKYLHVDKVHVVGISMGGVIAEQLAFTHPEIVNRLVLVNTFDQLVSKSPLHWGYYAGRFLLLQLLGLKTQAKTVAKHIFPHPGQEEMRQMLVAEVIQSNPKAYRSAMLALARFNSTSRLKEIQSPTLVITGDCDTTVDPAIQAQMAKKIPGARQVIVNGAGHAVSVDHAEEFNRLILDFLTP